MAIQMIQEERCVGCGRCVYTCPVDVLRMDRERHKAVVAYPEDCGCCIACYYECSSGAIVITPEQNYESCRSW